MRDDFSEKRISLLELDCLLGIRNISNIRGEGTETHSVLEDCVHWVYLLLSVGDDLLDYEVKVSEFVQPESHQGGIHIVFLANKPAKLLLIHDFLKLVFLLLLILLQGVILPEFKRRISTASQEVLVIGNI